MFNEVITLTCINHNNLKHMNRFQDGVTFGHLPCNSEMLLVVLNMCFLFVFVFFKGKNWENLPHHLRHREKSVLTLNTVPYGLMHSSYS